MKFLFSFKACILLCSLAVWPAFAQPGGAAGGKAAETAADAAALAQLDQVQADPAQDAAALKQGAKLATFCANCHGANGNSANPDTPNLAEQNSHYLLEQMLKFADGRRKNDFKGRLIRFMRPDERLSMALYYARQSVSTTLAPGSAALVAQGKAYYAKTCFRCHGGDGYGTETYARLAGQQEAYVVRTLERYREGTANTTRMDPLMAESTKLMDDQTIRAVAAYVASMH
jgi:cytochrome c553